MITYLYKTTVAKMHQKERTCRCKYDIFLCLNFKKQNKKPFNLREKKNRILEGIHIHNGTDRGTHTVTRQNAQRNQDRQTKVKYIKSWKVNETSQQLWDKEKKNKLPSALHKHSCIWKFKALFTAWFCFWDAKGWASQENTISTIQYQIWMKGEKKK